MSCCSLLILYNEPVVQETASGFQESEAGVLAEVAAVAQTCRKLRRPYREVGVRSFDQLPGVLTCADEPVVFNLVEGFTTNAEQANLVPAVCAAFGKACTGNSTSGLLLSLDKWQSKMQLEGAGLPTPKAKLIPIGQRFSCKELWPGPYIVKPVGADASEGIDSRSVVRDSGRTLKRTVARVHEQLHQAALIEQYIDGRELNISVLWRGTEPEVLPLAEIDFSAFDSDRPRIVGYEAKWLTDTFEYHHTPRIIPAPLPARVARHVQELAVAACRSLGCTDYCRVDMRLDQKLNPYILEVNANPDISPDAGFAAALEAANIYYYDFVGIVVENAFLRLIKPQNKSQHQARAKHTPDEICIQWCKKSHYDAVLGLLAGTRMFRPGEISIAREVLDDGIRSGPSGHYQSYVATEANEVLGWVCFGPTPCTLGTWDLYWIGVDSPQQGKGVGRKLMAFAESEILTRGGRRAIVETSGRAAYTPTLAFYERVGYRREAVVRDFYDIGDDKIILSKHIVPTDQT